MPSPPIQVFLTTIASQPALRQRQEYILRILQVKKIPFTSYDLASDENAKKLWKRKAPSDKQQLPGILIGGRFPGTFGDFEEAVECGDLDTFLRLNEAYDPVLEGDHPAQPAQPVGVPGASSPQQMTNQKPSFAASPSPLKNKGAKKDEFDVGEHLVGFGLQGVKATDDELLDLVKELGLGGDEAGELVKGLSSSSHSNLKQDTEEDDKAPSKSAAEAEDHDVRQKENETLSEERKLEDPKP